MATAPLPPTSHLAATDAPTSENHELGRHTDLEYASPTEKVAPHFVVTGQSAPVASSSKDAVYEYETSSRPVRQRALVQRPVDRWTILPNLQDPKTYRRRDKAGIVFVVALASFAGPCVSSYLYLSLGFFFGRGICWTLPCFACLIT